MTHEVHLSLVAANCAICVQYQAFGRKEGRKDNAPPGVAFASRRFAILRARDGKPRYAIRERLCTATTSAARTALADINTCQRFSYRASVDRTGD